MYATSGKKKLVQRHRVSLHRPFLRSSLPWPPVQPGPRPSAVQTSRLRCARGTGKNLNGQANTSGLSSARRKARHCARRRTGGAVEETGERSCPACAAISGRLTSGTGKIVEAREKTASRTFYRCLSSPRRGLYSRRASG